MVLMDHAAASYTHARSFIWIDKFSEFFAMHQRNFENIELSLWIIYSCMQVEPPV